MTIKQLIEHFKSSPESFEYYDQELRPNTLSQPTIIWQPKVQLGDYMSTIVHDPNNTHAVVVNYNTFSNELTCYIFLKAPANLPTISSATLQADCVISSKRPFERWRGNYRKFASLRNMIMANYKRKENMVYLKKLSSVFPDTMDTHLLDK